MKGLLKKDFYVLVRQTGLFVIMLLCFSFNENMYPFVIIYASMLPFTAMAYDERSKWSDLAAVMPYTPLDLVLSKYILGWLLMLVMAAAAAVIQIALGAARGSTPQLETLVLSLFMGILCIDVTQPILFRFGSEKARLFIMILVIGLACCSVSILQILVIGRVSIPTFARVLPPLLAVVGTPLSVLLSVKMYRRRMR